jgi:DNA-binding NtrC family response regulator
MIPPAPARRILVVDDDKAFRLSTAALLRQDGHEVDVAGDADEASHSLRATGYDLMLLDLRMPGLDGVRFLEVLRARGEGIPVIMTSGFGTIDVAVESLHLGAEDFLTKPVDPDSLSAKVREVLERRPSSDRVGDTPIPGMVGHAAAMRAVFTAIRKVAATSSTVLVTGETGTGKELVARAVHNLSDRAGGPFIPVNCAALSEGLLESELFGHTKGAFTGAVSDKIGLFAAADRGTLFLDEVGDMSLRLQQRLLRIIQDGEVTRVGAVRSERVDVRIVAAANRDLRGEIEGGRFREDLFYRLNIFPIRLPPLRERRADIPLLAEAALARIRERMPGANEFSCSPYAVQVLRGHHWPGNVRELFAALESAAIQADGRRIEAHHLPAEIRRRVERTSDLAFGIDAEEEARYRATVEPNEERSLIAAALDEAGGARTRAAEILGMSRTTLWRKIREYGLDE